MRKLTLVKTNKQRAKQKRGKATSPIPNPALLNEPQDGLYIELVEKLDEATDIQPQPLTPAEQAESARFKALTEAKAAQQAKVRLLKSQLKKQDDTARAA